MAFLDFFKKKHSTPAPSPSPAAATKPTGPITADLVQRSAMISAKLPEFLPTEQDVWWFLAEQYDRSIDCGNMHRRMFAISPLQMFEIEYEGRKSENSYVGKPNAGVAYLQEERRALATEVGSELADIAITQAFIFFAMQNMPGINAIRVKYATHFHNNCIRDGAYNNAERWQDVIDDIENR